MGKAFNRNFRNSNYQQFEVVFVPFPPNAIALLKDIIQSRDRALPSTRQKPDRAPQGYYSITRSRPSLNETETRSRSSKILFNHAIAPFPQRDRNPIALLKDIIQSRDRATAQESLQQLFNF